MDSPASKSHLFKEKEAAKPEKVYSLEDYKSIPFIPEVILTVEEFADPINSIIKYREKYEAFGAIKICPPSVWKPDFVFGLEEKSITTRKQIIQDLSKGKVQLFFFFFFYSLRKIL